MKSISPSSGRFYRLRVPELTAAEAIANIDQFAGCNPVTPDDLIAASPIRIPPTGLEQATALFRALYGPNEIVSVVFKSWRGQDGRGRPGLPELAQDSKHVRWWLKEISVPESEYAPDPSEFGTWFRINPLKSKVGSGKRGCFKDVDVARYCHFLVEADAPPIEAQARLLASLPLPVVAVIDSGGRSLHAIVRLDAASLESYRDMVRAIYGWLYRFGIDASNANPSRMSRLPGFPRNEGAREPGLYQRLLYLDPCPDNSPILNRKATTNVKYQPK